MVKVPVLAVFATALPDSEPIRPLPNTATLAGPPGLKDLPVPLLFRSTGFDSVETELVVVVTPYLVEPGHRDDFALPTDGFVPPDTLQDMLFLGRLNKVYGGGREVDGQLRGPGFVLE